MKQWLSILVAAGLLLYPFATFAADYGSQTSQTQQSPPVAQPLVREGDFAIKLAATLDLGAPTDEAVAEDMLAKAGVAPLNGWISDYPVTPEIIGQLHDSIARAADDGKLPMTSDQATRGLSYLVSRTNLPTPAGAESAPNAPQPAPAQASSPTVINNYYNEAGPPIVTYYPPPYDYVYLYDWVPYPVWWFGFWFPGFYICNDFTTTIVVSTPLFVDRDGFGYRDRDDRWGERRAVVSNHVIDPVTRTVMRVDPVERMGGRERPETVLRAPSGRTFTSLAEMRRVVKVSGLTAVRPATAETRMAGGFRTAEARKSAGAIYSRSAAGMWYDKGQARSSYRGGEGRTSVPSRSHGTSTGRGSESVRPYDRQGTTGGRSYNYYNSGPSRSYERSYQRRYDSPGSFGRSYGGGPHSQSLRPRSGYRLPGRGNYSHGAFSTLGQRSR